ncbi:MAG: hypothetical protein H8E40_13300 [Chloroflexi bacterium]|nr:hypothetical protein [Chloroflexota bacterium]
MRDSISDIEAIEAEAEKILESARSRANEILLKGKEEVAQILSSDLPMGEVETECQEIVHKATEEAQRTGEELQKKAAQIRRDAENKVVKIAERMASIVTGARSR